MSDTLSGAFAFVIVVVVCIMVVFFGFVGCGAAKNWSRTQKRADAKNNVAITHIKIQQAQQQAKIAHAQNQVIQAQADQRVIKAVGIRKAQDHIAATLTPYYLQWEAIQAQLEMAHSTNHTLIWAPSGPNGVPLVSTISPTQVAEGK